MPASTTRTTRAATRATRQVSNTAVKREDASSLASQEPVLKRVKMDSQTSDTKIESTSSEAEHDSEQASDTGDNNTDSARPAKKQKRSKDEVQAEKKWKTWSANATSTPFPDFKHPTLSECQSAYDVLNELHSEAVKAEVDEHTPETIPIVMDALITAVLSQATSWSNAKRAMDSMKKTYGSVFAYDKIYEGGSEKLQETIRCGGLHVRKTKIIMSILEDVKKRYGRWDLDHLLKASDEDAMKELVSYKYVGAKSAFVVLGWSLKRQRFTVDTHVYRIAGLWGWRPKEATVGQTQSHLDALIPNDMKLQMHFLLIQHGRTCPACRGGSKGQKQCEVRDRVR